MLTLNFPSFPTLQTERLILRAHKNADAQALFALRSNETVMKYIYRERPKDIFDVQTLITTLNKGFENGDNLVWAIALKDNPSEMIGEVGYYRTDFANHRAEIGYMLNPDYWRKELFQKL